MASKKSLVKIRFLELELSRIYNALGLASSDGTKHTFSLHFDLVKKKYFSNGNQTVSLVGPAAAGTELNKKALITFRNTIYLLLKKGATPGTHSLTYSLTYSLTHLLTHLLTHSLTYSPTHSLTYSLTHLLTHLLTHSLTHSLSLIGDNDDMFRRFNLLALKKRKQNLSQLLWTQNNIEMAVDYAQVTKQICLMSNDALVLQDALRVDYLWSEMIRQDVYSVAAARFNM